MVRKFRLASSLLLCFSLFSMGCSGAGRGGAVNFATEGPDLFVKGEYKGQAFAGTVERKVLIGLGKMQIKGETGELLCKANFNSPPQPNLRVRGIMLCEGLEPLGVTISPLGPDQGLGIARQAEDEDLMVFFFHPSKEEAELRFPDVQAQIENAKKQR